MEVIDDGQGNKNNANHHISTGNGAKTSTTTYLNKIGSWIKDSVNQGSTRFHFPRPILLLLL